MNEVSRSRSRRALGVAVFVGTLLLASGPTSAAPHQVPPTCEVVPVEGEATQVVLVTRASEDDLAVDRSVRGAIAASDGTLELVKHVVIGGDGGDATGLVPAPVPLTSLDEEEARSVIEVPGAFVLLAGDEALAADLNDSDRPDLFLRRATAFVTDWTDHVDDAAPADSLRRFYVSKAATVGVGALLPDDAALDLKYLDGVYEIDVVGRPSNISVPLSAGGAAPALTVGDDAVCDGLVSLPARLTFEGPTPVEGAEVVASIEGRSLTGTVPAAPKNDTAPDDDGTGDPATTEDGTLPPPEKDEGANLLVPLLVLALVGAGVGVFLVQRKGATPPPLAGPDSFGGPPPPGAPPPSPHGPSPTSYGAASGAPAPVAAPAAFAAPVPVGPTGRAVTAPAFGPIVLDEPAPGWTAAVPGGAAVRVSDLGIMRIMPADSSAGRTWAVHTPVALASAAWLEKKEGRGEDAEPTLRLHESGRGILAVYDGVGGAGSAPARRLRDGTELPGAYVASRLARDLVEAWYAGVVEAQESAADPDGLRDWLHGAFQDEAEFVLESTTGLKGSLSRVLPTTVAALAFGSVERDGRRATIVDALWAGDSRAYVLTPTEGLQVLTTDDTRETDALALIRNDQPMDNLVAADRPFEIHHHKVRVDGPAVLLCATDGAFGYVRTPAHFEHLLLRSLTDARDVGDWSTRLLDDLAEFAGDDVTWSLAAVGFDSFADVRRAFADRAEYLASEHWAPFERNGGDREALEEVREQSWAVYRDLYHARRAARG